jgi:hypothetical protein
MAFKATGGTSEQLSEVLNRLRSMARTVSGQATSMINKSAEGDTSARAILDYAADLSQTRDEFNRLKATPDLAAYAQEQFGDITYDVQAEFVTMLAAIDTVLAWIVANMPASNGNPKWLQIEEIVGGVLVTRGFTPVQTNQFRVELAALVATID